MQDSELFGRYAPVELSLPSISFYYIRKSSGVKWQLEWHYSFFYSTINHMPSNNELGDPHRSPTDAKNGEPQSPQNSSLGKKKILIVDDDEILRDIYVAIFREENFEVATATDGQEAWERLQGGFIPDVIFTGILMPRLTGFELIAKLKADSAYARTIVVISSHRGLPEHERLARDLNVNDFVVQGTTPPAEVKRRIKLLLGIPTIFRISVKAEQLDAPALLNLINLQQHTTCSPNQDQKIVLELEATKEPGTFVVRAVANHDGQRKTDNATP